ncbi:DUF6090 family protein [Shewanella gelidimarina]|uniref:DUF6090 family protein n=1 Tax=Shewanella gelidimarina TaxID=56813 RepID=UPI00200CF56C|nr:DUF6090 family protein [Shewanella gelidimarina]
MFLQLKRIRHNLLSDGKIGKYIFYAIGEIFLVVVGILIALQVNNHNIEKKADLVEFQYYQTMQTQLIEDQELLSAEIYGITERINDYVVGVELIVDADREQLNKLAAKVYRLLEYGDFRRKSSVYQTLIYSGEIIHIKNRGIVSSLQELERTYQIVERLEVTQANLVMTHTAPLINELLDFESGELVFPDLVFTHSFKNRFSLAIRLASEKKQELEHALTVIEHTLKAIDAELRVKL